MAAEWNRATFIIDNILHDHTNFLTGIRSFLTQSGWEKASWSDGTYGALDEHYLRTDRTTQPRWQFTGDGPTQYVGLRVFYDSDPNTTTGTTLFTGEEHIVLQTFLQNSGATDRQVLTPDYVGTSGSGASQSHRFGSCRIRYDDAAPNNVLIVGGEDGLYIESGRDSLATNLGHAAIMGFGAIPELYGVYDDSVRWTAQGLVCDLFDACRFSESRNDRYVSNDGSDKNFTAGLQPYSARGTSDITSPSMFDQRPYYIGSRDSILGLCRGSTSPDSNPAVSTTGDVDLTYGATFGLLNTPQSGRFRLSPLLMVQDLHQVFCGVSSSAASDNVAPTSAVCAYLDPRAYRQIFRFAAVDHTLLPFATIQDGATGAIYRVATVDDDGRFSKIGIEWPAGEITVSVT